MEAAMETASSGCSSGPSPKLEAENFVLPGAQPSSAGMGCLGSQNHPQRGAYPGRQQQLLDQFQLPFAKPAEQQGIAFNRYVGAHDGAFASSMPMAARNTQAACQPSSSSIAGSPITNVSAREEPVAPSFCTSDFGTVLRSTRLARAQAQQPTPQNGCAPISQLPPKRILLPLQGEEEVASQEQAAGLTLLQGTAGAQRKQGWRAEAAAENGVAAPDFKGRSDASYPGRDTPSRRPSTAMQTRTPSSNPAVTISSVTGESQATNALPSRAAIPTASVAEHSAQPQPHLLPLPDLHLRLQYHMQPPQELRPPPPPQQQHYQHQQLQPWIQAPAPLQHLPHEMQVLLLPQRAPQYNGSVSLPSPAAAAAAFSQGVFPAGAGSGADSSNSMHLDAQVRARLRLPPKRVGHPGLPGTSAQGASAGFGAGVAAGQSLLRLQQEPSSVAGAPCAFPGSAWQLGGSAGPWGQLVDTRMQPSGLRPPHAQQALQQLQLRQQVAWAGCGDGLLRGPVGRTASALAPGGQFGYGAPGGALSTGCGMQLSPSLERPHSSVPQAVLETKNAAARLRQLEQLGVSPSQAVLAAAGGGALACRLNAMSSSPAAAGAAAAGMLSECGSPGIGRLGKRNPAERSWEGFQAQQQLQQQQQQALAGIGGAVFGAGPYAHFVPGLEGAGAGPAGLAAAAEAEAMDAGADWGALQAVKRRALAAMDAGASESDRSFSFSQRQQQPQGQRHEEIFALRSLPGGGEPVAALVGLQGLAGGMHAAAPMNPMLGMADGAGGGNAGCDPFGLAFASDGSIPQLPGPCGITGQQPYGNAGPLGDAGPMYEPMGVMGLLGSSVSNAMGCAGALGGGGCGSGVPGDEVLGSQPALPLPSTAGATRASNEAMDLACLGSEQDIWADNDLQSFIADLCAPASGPESQERQLADEAAAVGAAGAVSAAGGFAGMGREVGAMEGGDAAGGSAEAGAARREGGRAASAARRSTAAGREGGTEDESGVIPQTAMLDFHTSFV